MQAKKRNDFRYRLYASAYDLYKKCDTGRKIAEKYMDAADQVKNKDCVNYKEIYDEFLTEQEDFCDSLYFKIMQLRCESIGALLISLTIFIDALFFKAWDKLVSPEYNGLIFLMGVYATILSTLSIIWVKKYFSSEQ